MRLGRLALTAAALTLSLSNRAQPQQAPTLKVYSRETVVDITVTDSHGNPVHGLTQSDFTIKEDNKPQSIRSFHEYATQPVPPQPKLPPNTYTNLQPPAPSAATNFLFLDFANSAPVLAVACCEKPLDPTSGPLDLSYAMERQRAIKQEAKKYIQNMPPGTRIGVLGLSYPGSLRILEGVTSDPVLLSAAIDTLQFDTDGATMVDGRIQGLIMNTWCPQQERRNRMAIESLSQIAADLAPIKGRKNLLWFGVGMVSMMLPDERPPCLTDYTQDLNKAFSALAAAQVTVFPISSEGPMKLEALAVAPDEDAAKDLAMEAVAEAGGGVAFYNNNDIAGAAAKAIATGSDYYTISYVPPGTEYDGRHHSIKVETNQKDLHLTYRDSYYAEDPSKITPTPGLTLATLTTSGPIDTKSAMGRAMPTSTGILFNVEVNPSAETRKPSDPAILGTLDPKLKSKPLTRYSFAYDLPASQIAFTPGPNNTHHGTLELDIAVYDGSFGGDGQLLTGLSQTVNMTLSDARYAEFIKGPFRFTQQLDLPSGPLFLRVGVLDPTANKLGTLEIPLTVPKSPTQRTAATSTPQPNP